jgi:DNA-3-methyladenine glycosylase I
MAKAITRCRWAEGVSLDYICYHDKEWGVPVRDDRTQFEFLILEGAQAGLSWSTILNKREGYRCWLRPRKGRALHKKAR